MVHSSQSHPPADAALSPGLRRLAWLNIAVQAAFPLAVAFTPVMAGASEQRFLSQPAPLTAQRTKVYTLEVGETAASVAKKYNIPLNLLRELNQFRTFVHSFDHLQAGDELDVPVAPFPEVRWDDVPAASVSGHTSEDMQANKVAGYASQAGSFLSSSAKSEAAASMARSMATGAVGGEVQQWLSRFGTARIQLEADKNFSLKNSQLDLLVPLYEQKDSLVFSQGSIHRTDDRTQSNLGFGFRWFAADWMLGANTFLDYDLSRDHARLGLGGEYWRDFLKLGFNGYTYLTGWRDSPDLADYQERPANGWDVRAQAWLPSLPQLGGKLTYEQYYGKEVALFGVDSRQRNPHAITTGINYTPVPLITLGAEQRQGQSGKSDSRFTVDMSYQLGAPWRSQVSPDAVAVMRTLRGSRYDLVERNNNIVLEYRKKEVIRLKTADLVTGYAGEQKSLGVSVTSKYGLERIDWDAAALAAAGGKILQNGSDYAVMLPAYQTSAQGVNTYTVIGMAVDRKGNRSDRSYTLVTVQAPEVNKRYSTFIPVSSVLPADGKSSQVLTLTLRDGNNQAVDMDVKDISLNSSALKSAKVSSLTRKSAGVYTVTVTAGTDAETVTLTPSVSGITLSPAGVTISSVKPDEATSAISTDKTTYASGADMLITVTLKDANGNAVSGAAASLTADTVTVANATLKGGSWKDNSDGTYTRTYTATTAGTGLKATVKLSGWAGKTESGAYAIIIPVELEGVTVNGYTFTKDAGFPTTGFKGAEFTLKLSSGSASDLTWTSDASWVSVRDGVVSFTGTGTKDKVTIMGTPKSGGTAITYSFTLSSWYINDGSTRLTWTDAAAYCSAQSGYSQATVQQLNGNASQSHGIQGTLGGLWSEWGNVSSYSGAGFFGNNYWSSEQRSLTGHYGVLLSNGKVYSYSDFTTHYVVCRQGL